MDLTNLFESLLATLGESLPSVLGALLILIIGWFVAIIVRAGVRKGLNLLRIDERVGTSTGSEIDIASGFATAAYYVVLLVALVAFFNALKLEQVSGTLQ